MENYGMWLALASFIGTTGTMFALVITTKNTARTTTVDMLSAQIGSLREQLAECKEHATRSDLALAIAREEVLMLTHRVMKLEG